MKVKFLTAIASHDWAYKPGDVAILEREEVAQAWIAAGIVEPFNPEPEVVNLAPSKANKK